MTLHEVDLDALARELEALATEIKTLQDTGQSHRICTPRRRNRRMPLRPSPILENAPQAPPNQQVPLPRNEELEAAKEVYGTILSRIKWLQASWVDPELIKAPSTVREALTRLESPLRTLQGVEKSRSPMPGDLLNNLNGLLQKAVECLRETVPQAMQADKGQPDEIDDNAENKKPAQLLMNWREILVALDRDNTKESKRSVAGLNKNYSGPIRIGTQGRQPLVDKQKLLDWWGSLELMFDEREQRRKDAKATVGESCNYGRDATVLPEISGGVKRRRSSRKSE